MPNNLLVRALLENDFHFPAELQNKFITYLSLLQQWNQVYNLTAITDPRQSIYLHILDSLIIAPYLHGQRMIDVGTGAGLPGVPLALIEPKHHWTLLDKTQKKIHFLTQVQAELGLKNITPIASRVETFHPAAGFDTIVTRAFASLALILEKTQHLATPSGWFIAMKGVYPKEELQEIPKGFTVHEVRRLVIKGFAAERHVVCIQRNSS